MFKLKFSKKSIASISFLLVALLISLFLGSYNFMPVYTNASLPQVMENFEGKPPAAAASPAASHAASPAAAPAASPAASSKAKATSESSKKTPAHTPTAAAASPAAKA